MAHRSFRDLELVDPFLRSVSFPRLQTRNRLPTPTDQIPLRPPVYVSTSSDTAMERSQNSRAIAAENSLSDPEPENHTAALISLLREDLKYMREMMQSQERQIESVQKRHVVFMLVYP